MCGSIRSERAVVGEPLLHPLMLAALALLVVNDHWLKHAAPGWVTGKLSDFAGLCFFPLLLQAAWELPTAARRRLRAHSPTVLLGASLLTAGVFALVQLWQPAALGCRYGLGVIGWPLWAAVAWIEDAALPALAPVALTQDVSDLLALPMTFVALALDRAAWAKMRMIRRSSVAVSIAVLLGSRAAHAAENERAVRPYYQVGVGPSLFSGSAEADVGFATVDSAAEGTALMSYEGLGVVFEGMVGVTIRWLAVGLKLSHEWVDPTVDESYAAKLLKASGEDRYRWLHAGPAGEVHLVGEHLVLGTSIGWGRAYPGSIQPSGGQRAVLPERRSGIAGVLWCGGRFVAFDGHALGAHLRFAGMASPDVRATSLSLVVSFGAW